MKELNKSVVFEVYEPWCNKCKILDHVLTQVGQALGQESAVVMTKMSVDEYENSPYNHDETESDDIPQVKILNTREPRVGNDCVHTYKGDWDAQRLLRWIHLRSDASFDVDKAIERSKQEEMHTRSKMRAEVANQIDETKESVPKLMARSPCKAPFVDYYLAYLGFVSERFPKQAAITSFKTCLRSNAYRRYLGSLKTSDPTAADQLRRQMLSLLTESGT